MKKFLLFAAAAALTAGFAIAEDTAPVADGGWVNLRKDKRCADAGLEKNFVVNGNFDDPNYVSRDDVYGEWYPYEEEVKEASEIPGWFIQTAGQWNGTVQINPQVVDNYMFFEGNTQYLHMSHYDRNGWTRVKVISTIKDLEKGKKYTLDMYVCSKYDGVEEWSHPDHGFSIYDMDPTGELMHEVVYYDKDNNPTDTVVEPFKGQLLYENKSISEEADWNYFRYTFTPLSEVVFLELWSYIGHGSDGDYESGYCWVDFDEIRVYDDSKADYSVANPESGIQFIDLDDNDVEYFTLQGVRMPANADLHGTFIAKSGKRVNKVYIR